jgi:hypothetical protein
VSGVATGKAPADDVELLRDVLARLRALERATTVRVGSWVLSEIDGEVVASKAGQRVVLTEEAITVAAATGRTMRLVTLTGAPTGGTFALTYKARTTTNIHWNDTADNVLAALLALSGAYTTLDFAVTGPDGGPWTITTPVGSLSADNVALTGGTTPAVAITAAT